MSAINSIKSINISNVWDIANEAKSFAKKRNLFIQQIGTIKSHNGFGSFLVELKNPFIKGMWVSGKEETDSISSIAFSKPEMTITEFLLLCPNAQEKYNAHDEERAYVGSNSGISFIATIGKNEEVEKLSILW